MKMIGFREEYDKILVNSKCNFNWSDKTSPLTDIEIKMLTLYFKQSYIVASKTWALFDNENYLGPYMIYSDGEWIWPSYFLYYLDKERSIYSDFIEHIKNKNFIFTPLTLVQKKEATVFFENAMLDT